MLTLQKLVAIHRHLVFVKPRSTVPVDGSGDLVVTILATLKKRKPGAAGVRP